MTDHGEDTPVEAATRADAVLEGGDLEGYRRHHAPAVGGQAVVDITAVFTLILNIKIKILKYIVNVIFIITT